MLTRDDLQVHNLYCLSDSRQASRECPKWELMLFPITRKLEDSSGLVFDIVFFKLFIGWLLEVDHDWEGRYISP